MLDVSAITPEWLTHRLIAGGHLADGEVKAIDVFDIHKHHCLLKVQYSADVSPNAPKSLFLKIFEAKYSWGAREGIFYAEVAPFMPEGLLPKCYSVVARDASDRTYILLEDLSSTHAATPPSLEERLDIHIWDRVVDTYSMLHTFWWEHPGIGKGNFVQSFGLGVAHEATSTKLVLANQRYFVEQAFPGWLARDGHHFSDEWHRTCEQTIATWTTLFLKRMVDGKALTLIQGDAHWQNVLLPYHPDQHTPVIVDWEGFTRGIGVWDLSRLLISSSLPSEFRRQLEARLLLRYHNRLVLNGITNYTLENCRDDYRLCLIANVLLSFDWGDVNYMRSAMDAFADWECEHMGRQD